MKILIVDDNFQNREATADLLRYDGHEVQTAVGALDVIIRLDDVPDAVLLDYLLNGGVDGLELLKEMRRHKGWDQVPIVLLTADVYVHPEKEQAGPFALLLKPATAEEIYQAILTARDKGVEGAGQ